MIRKAVIPIAGLGTRMGPLARIVPKAMFPLVDREGHAWPVIHIICREAAAAGLAEAIVVVLPQHLGIVESYFAALGESERRLLPRISLVTAEARGFGYAVLKASDCLDRESFMLFLGDHVHLAEAGVLPCAAQLAAAYARRGGAAMIGMQSVGEAELSKVGVAGGEPLGEDTYLCRHFVEKPDLATARSRLASPHLPQGQYLAHCGIYIFAPEILDCLRTLEAAQVPGTELQLAAAQSMLLAHRPDSYYLFRIRGRAYDTGTPEGYATAQAAFHRS
ncbi:MAG: sugar phosphate nucleotidyltransferase [Phycisphaerae bacterium]|jgi:UTP--glucose-1-phosphate uridylyltransferase